MSAITEAVSAVIIPATVALLLYILFSFIILPAVRRYRSRYDQYVPLQSVTNNIAARTSSVRERFGDALSRFVLPRVQRRIVRAGDNESSEDLYDLEEGEEMDDFLERTGPELEGSRPR